MCFDDDPNKIWNDPALSPRTRAALRRLDIDTVEKLRTTSDNILLREPNFGIKALAEARAFMNVRLYGYDNAHDMTYDVAFETIKKQRIALIEQEKIIMELQKKIAVFQALAKEFIGD